MTIVRDVNMSASLALVGDEYVPLLAWHLQACQPMPTGSTISLKQAHSHARQMHLTVGMQPMLAGWSRFEEVLRSEHNRVHRPGQQRLLCPRCREECEAAASRA